MNELKEKRQQLEIEKKKAKYLLKKNLEETKLSTYLLDKELYTSALDTMTSDPLILLEGADKLSKLALDDDHSLRKVIEYSKMAATIYQALDQKN